MGQSAKRRDGVDKVTGKAVYAGDVVLPGGVLHARVLRPPAHGATMGQVDTSAAEKRPGVRVVRDGDLVAVLHEHWDEADKALALVKAEWTRHDPPVDDKTMYDHFRKTAGPARTAAEGGNLAEGEKLAAEVVEGTYYDSYVAHAPMEPHSATAAVENGKVTVWAGTQTPFPVKDQLMRALKLPADKVRVITPYVGGGFGGKSASRQAVEAARLAMLTGKPVRVVFNRQEEFFYDTFRPASIVRIRAGLTASKTIALWDYMVYCAGERGAAHFYDIPHHKTAWTGGWSGNSGALHPFAVGPWRAPGASSNAFGRESHIDVLAAKAGMDPVEFRLKNLSDARMVRTLNAAVKKFGWTPKPAPSGRGVGVALGTDAGTYVALMVRGRRRQGHRQGPGEARRLRPGHGRRRESRRDAPADRRVHHDGARLHAERGGALQGRGGARAEPRDLRTAAILVAADDRSRRHRRARDPGAGRRRAGHRAARGGRRQRHLRCGRRPPRSDADDARARQGGDEGVGRGFSLASKIRNSLLCMATGPPELGGLRARVGPAFRG